MICLFGRIPLEDVVSQREIILFAHIGSHEGLYYCQKGNATMHVQSAVDYPESELAYSSY